MKPDTRLRSKGLVAAFLLALLSGCGGGSGADTEDLPDTSRAPTSNYSGPAPANNDVQAFKLNFWDNLARQDRCSGCHGTNGQSPTFVRNDDINLAYAEANRIVNLSSPVDSLVVSKVGGGHNCWLASDAGCADTLVSYIQRWAGGAGGNVSRVVLSPPPSLYDPGNSKSFPADSTEFGTTVYPLLRTYCSACHIENGQTPYIASDDEATSYAAAQSRIDLDTPSNSRLVQRLGNEFHNCWDGDCAASAAEMQAAITLFSDGITPTVIDPALVTSKAMLLTDGIPANTGGRYEDNVIAKYEFKTGEGRIAYDTSGVEPALHLTLSGDVNWVGGWGIQIVDGKAQGTTTASKKLNTLIKATGEYTVEAWVVPGNVTQEDARIISYSGGTEVRNFTLGQTLYNYDFLHRSSTTDANGMVALSTADDAERLQATLQHVVAVFTPGEGRKLYVNGEYTEDLDSVAAGNLSEWDETFALVLGNEVSNDRLWQGTLRLVAIHNRALTAEQVLQNYTVGVGEKFFVLFSVAHLIDVPESYIVFQVSQFDSFSYLFAQPFFISLNAEASPSSIAIRGLNLGVNGREVTAGQAFANLDTALSAENYDSENGQRLSSLGTIIALEKGPQLDEFFLTFDQIGSNSYTRVEATPPTPAVPTDSDPAPMLGLRTFEEINATMSALTGVSRTQSGVAATYATIYQQLPASDAIEGFLSAHQMAITQLAIQYCDALVEDSSLRSSYFPGFNFSAPVSTAFDSSGRTLINSALYQKMVGTSLSSQPSSTDVSDELNDLMDRLTSCGGSCSADRTKTVVKAACAAVLGSAVTLIQ